MFSMRKIIVNILLVSGVTLLGFSIYDYSKIKVEQKFISKQSINFSEKDTVSLSGLAFDYIDDMALSPKSRQLPDIKKESFKRSDYENGMMIIDIPKLKVKAPVIKGTTENLLKLGPGLYEKSVLPDKENGNVCIAAHRTTYGAWFRKVDSLEVNDDIVLEFSGQKYTYKVEKVFIVEKNDWSVTDDTGYSAITLTACHPPGSDRQRIVVRGRLVV